MTLRPSHVSSQSQRSLRSGNRQRTESDQATSDVLELPFTISIQPSTTPVTALSSSLPSRIEGLSTPDSRTLHSKQARLQHDSISYDSILVPLPSQIPPPPSSPYPFVRAVQQPPALAKAIAATLVFAQQEAGTAVCISPTGLLLTCAHCIAESPAQPDYTARHWLLFSDGRAVQATAIRWDPRRDLALLQIVAAQPSSLPFATGTTPFPFLEIASRRPSRVASLICIGHPGSEDFEAPVLANGALAPTNYEVLHVSEGTWRGYVRNADVQDNSEIGALQHDCWTYWGHSGAPLICTAKGLQEGRLVGLHSSWDDETGRRRGVGVDAIWEFLAEREGQREVIDLTED